MPTHRCLEVADLATRVHAAVGARGADCAHFGSENGAECPIEHTLHRACANAIHGLPLPAAVISAVVHQMQPPTNPRGFLNSRSSPCGNTASRRFQATERCGKSHRCHLGKKCTPAHNDSVNEREEPLPRRAPPGPSRPFLHSRSSPCGNTASRRFQATERCGKSHRCHLGKKCTPAHNDSVNEPEEVLPRRAPPGPSRP
mmetsp:Transcript_117559/g.332590  ORF Transcript_117559/g.332590 Transcript_117559/m.332590 type:complete len:200 (-) Transcript_117559:113-712(-)